MSDVALGTDLPSPAVRRRRTEFVGAMFATAGVAMYFAALFAIYLAERASFLAASPNAAWIPDSADLQLTQPTMIAWTLIISVVTMQWAVYASARDDRWHSIVALGLTGIFAVAVINQVVFQFLQMGLSIDDGSTSTVLIYTICWSHVALVGVSIAYMTVWAFRNLGSPNTSINSQGIAALAVFWYGLVVAYQIIWLAIFVTK